MEMCSNESDDEVFIGKLSLKEIKKRVLWTKKLEIRRCPQDKPEEVDCNKSLKIIEIHSEPDLTCDNKKHSIHQLRAVSNPVISPMSSPTSAWDIKPSDDSFLQIEKMVSDLSVSCKEDKSVELDNTLDVINYILKNGPSQNYENYSDTNTKQVVINKACIEPTVMPEGEVYSSMVKPVNKTDAANICSKPCVTPTKSTNEKTAGFVTPCSNVKTKTRLFKTPGIPISHRKTPASSVKKTPSKTKNYEHIASPVASYIKNCPIVPLVKDVRPTKPLPGPSAIPKFVKGTHSKVENKENVNLPTIAYKSAKKTRVIDVPDEEKLPQSQWAKKITSSLPRPLVMKHNHRELKFTKRTLASKQEDSFADLSLQQAEVSVCTQKSAFNMHKKA